LCHHDYKQSWRRRIEREASRIQAVDLDASREFAVLYVDDFDRPFRTLFFESIGSVTQINRWVAGS